GPDRLRRLRPGRAALDPQGQAPARPGGRTRAVVRAVRGHDARGGPAVNRVTPTREEADLQERGTGAGHPQARFGNGNALVHGARSPRLIAAKARAKERAFLRRNGLKASHLDPITREVLRLYARGLAVLELREAGGADEARDYWTAFNATRRCLERLEA